MIKEMAAREQHRLEWIVVLDSQLEQGMEPLKARLQTIPNGWRDYRMITQRLHRLVRQLYETLPPNAVRHFYALERYGEVALRLRSVDARSKMSILQTSDLKMLINKAMGAECAICLKPGGHEVKKCELRKTLQNVAPPVAQQETECPYSIAARGCDLENYV